MTSHAARPAVTEANKPANRFRRKASGKISGIFDTTQPINVNNSEPGAGGMPNSADASTYLGQSHQAMVLQVVRQ